MSAASTLGCLYLGYFSKPAAERPLYRAVARSRASRIVEIGIGLGQRSLRLIEVAQRFSPQVQYTGIDLFEARPAIAPGTTLKRAHRLFAATGARVRLIPGDPLTALARSANLLADSDLVVIAADQDRTSVTQAMFYLPRMIHTNSLVFIEEANATAARTVFRPMLPIEISRLSEIANRGSRSLRAA